MTIHRLNAMAKVADHPKDRIVAAERACSSGGMSNGLPPGPAPVGCELAVVRRVVLVRDVRVGTAKGVVWMGSGCGSGDADVSPANGVVVVDVLDVEVDDC